MKLFRVDSDKQQIAAIRNGDEKAFARVYEHYWKKLLAISFQHTKDKGMAEEIVQEVFVSLWQRRNSLASCLASCSASSALASLCEMFL